MNCTYEETTSNKRFFSQRIPRRRQKSLPGWLENKKNLAFMPNACQV